MEDPNAATTVSPPPTHHGGRNPFDAGLALDDMEPAPLGPLPTGPRRRLERTEVVATSNTAGMPWTANPMVWIAGVFAAFVAGAVLVFVMVKTMMPSQPVVVQGPAPGSQTAARQPVMPVVTPLESGRPPMPDEIPPSPVERHGAKHATTRHAAATVAKAEPWHKLMAKSSAANDDDDDDSAPAAAPAPRKTMTRRAGAAKAEKAKGGDWVDPFAQ